jgi:D-threo-aldose 1-dehydrogenase
MGAAVCPHSSLPAEPLTALRSVSLTSRLESSALGLGCANLFREPSARRRLRLLEAAYDCGVTHFDVAPMYGLGVAEAELGRFARGRRDRIVIATKFGLAPTRLARQVGRIQAPVRRLFLSMPSLRERARSSAAGPSSGRGGALLYTKEGYDSRSARRSLENSLRALRTDYLDLLLLHDPEPGDVEAEATRPFLEDAVSRGDIREWGIAGEPEVTFAVARSFDTRVPIMQVRDDILAGPPQTLRDDADSRITFGVLARPLGRLVAHLAEPSTRQRWSDATGVDCGSTEELVHLLLLDALVTNPRGTVLYSSIHEERIHAAALLADALSETPSPGLETFRGLVGSELRDTAPAADR